MPLSFPLQNNHLLLMYQNQNLVCCIGGNKRGFEYWLGLFYPRMNIPTPIVFDYNTDEEMTSTIIKLEMYMNLVENVDSVIYLTHPQKSKNDFGLFLNFIDVDFDDIRDDSMFEARLIEPEDSTTIGGARYTNVGNNAQVGSSTQITIASNDKGTTAEYVGQRIILTSGVGTGQYGYIQAYNDSTKVATIYRETTDTIGWDHIIPGTPIESALATNTQYRISPFTTEYNITEDLVSIA